MNTKALPRLVLSTIISLALILLLIPLLFNSATAKRPPAPSITASADTIRIAPCEMQVSGDVAVCNCDSSNITDATVRSRCEGVPPETIMLGVDPTSWHTDDWDGGSATASIYISDVASPQVAVLTVAWPDLDGRGIHSPLLDQIATINWDSVPIWTKRTRDVSTFGDYYAAQHQDVLATAVLTGPMTHTLTLAVPAQTAWDVSTITLQLHPMPETLSGIAYSPFRDCQNPHWGPFPSAAEVEEDLARLAHMTNGIRTYSALTITGEIPRIAHRYGVPVCAGAWLGREKDAEGNPVENKNREEIDALIDLANTVPLECVIVGNEVLLRGDLTVTQVVSYINEVQAAVPPTVSVTTAEIGGILRDHPTVLDAVDFIMVHIYAYWDSKPIDQAVDYVVEEYLQWREDYPNKRIVIGETGWPSNGPNQGQAVPSLENQQRFFYQFLAAAEQHDIEFYYFDAFDELWKREGGVGSHWGYIYADRTGKYEVQSVLVPQQYLAPFLGPLAGTDVHQGLVDKKVYLPLLVKNFPTTFVIFDEYCGEENHFAPSGWMGDWGDLDYYECERANPYNDQVSIRISYNPQGERGWAGIYWQEPDSNWGTIDGAGYDLDDATYLHFHARGARGGEQLKFLVGGIWGPYPDSLQPALSTDIITLTQSWATYTLDLRGQDLSHTIGGFAFVTNRCLNTEPITFYLDSIYYEIAGDPGPPAPTPPPETPYTFDVYRDRDVAGNHYVPSGWMGDIGDIHLDECWREDTYTGSGTAIRVEYTAQGNGPYECEGASPCAWAGVYWQDPADNWGDRPGGYDLTGARALTFRAKGENGGEKIAFKIGGVGCKSGAYPDSLCPARVFDPAPTILTNTWQVYTIPLGADLNLSSLVGGFLWTASRAENPTGATFYLDDIQYHFNIDMPSSQFSTPPIPIGSGSTRTFDLEFGDGDNDGWLDLALANHGSDQVCWNNRDRTFDCQNAFGGLTAFDVEWGDMDNDGYLDLVVTNSMGQPNQVCLNNQDRTFTCTTFSHCSGPGPSEVCFAALGDVDCDDDLDIALGTRYPGNVWEPDVIYYNDGDGLTYTTTSEACRWHPSLEMDFGDVDNDGDLDLAVVGHYSEYICINSGSCTGIFTETHWLSSSRLDENTQSLALGDADGDGDLDVAVGRETHFNEIYLNDSGAQGGTPGYFSEKLPFDPAWERTWDVTWGDVDDDGDLDLAEGNSYRPTVVYFNEPMTATAGFTLAAPVFLGAYEYRSLSVAFGNVDNDCDLDLATTRDRGQNVVYLNRLIGCHTYLPIIIKAQNR